MGHHLDAFIARREVLTGLPPLLPGARMRPLAQGLWLAPVTEDLRPRAMEAADNDDGGPFVRLVAVLDEIGRALSQRGDVAWIETDYFGGVGESRARLWRAGDVVIAEDGVNAVLRALGVVRVHERSELVEGSTLLRALRKVGVEPIKPRLLDEWDSVGLAEHRSTETCFARSEPVESSRQEET